MFRSDLVMSSSSSYSNVESKEDRSDNHCNVGLPTMPTDTLSAADPMNSAESARTAASPPQNASMRGNMLEFLVWYGDKYRPECVEFIESSGYPGTEWIDAVNVIEAVCRYPDCTEKLNGQNNHSYKTAMPCIFCSMRFCLKHLLIHPFRTLSAEPSAVCVS